MSLSILCVTKMEPPAMRFLMDMAELAGACRAQFVIALDGEGAWDQIASKGDSRYAPVILRVRSGGYIESVLDEAVAACGGDYVLRLDDDERASGAMMQWLERREYAKADHWKFARANLWDSPEWLMLTSHLWRDDQTRLSVKVKAGGRRVIHSGSPHGGGELAPCMILHEKFLVKTAEERRAIVRRYDSIQPGAGRNFLPWSVPEDFYEKVLLAPVGDGTVREWADSELRSVSLRKVAA